MGGKALEEVVIVSAVRTPFSRFDSAMAEVASVDLAVTVMREAVARVNVMPEEVDEINYGSCMMAELALQTDIPDRQAALLAGFPAETISVTLDRACCSSLTAVRLGLRALLAGEAEICMAVGADNMPRAPHLAPGLRHGRRLGHVHLLDGLFELGYGAKGFAPFAVDAGEVAVAHGVSREMQDAWALMSQERYARARAAGKYTIGEELVELVIPRRRGAPVHIERDESPRSTSLEALAKLTPIYGSPTVTPGNAPPMSAGAGAILFMTRRQADKRGLTPLAVIRGSVAMATDPREIAVIPALTIRKVLERAGVHLGDIDLIEINEAFAAMPLVSLKILAEGDERLLSALHEKTNVNGGAIAIGHPVGASASRITMHLAYELRRRGGGLGVAAICGGLGQGEAIVLEV